MAKKKRKTKADKAVEALEAVYNTASRMLQPPAPSQQGMSNRLFVAADKLREVMGCDCTSRAGPRGYTYMCGCGKPGRLGGLGKCGVKGRRPRR